MHQKMEQINLKIVVLGKDKETWIIVEGTVCNSQAVSVKEHSVNIKNIQI